MNRIESWKGRRSKLKCPEVRQASLDLTGRARLARSVRDMLDFARQALLNGNSFLAAVNATRPTCCFSWIAFVAEGRLVVDDGIGIGGPRAVTFAKTAQRIQPFLHVSRVSYRQSYRKRSSHPVSVAGLHRRAAPMMDWNDAVGSNC